MITIYRTAPAHQNRVQQGNNSGRLYEILALLTPECELPALAQEMAQFAPETLFALVSGRRSGCTATVA